MSFRHAPREKPFLLKPRRSSGQQRQRWLAWGALLAVPPALALLPVLGFLVVTPRFLHARALGVVLLAAIAGAEVRGTAWLVRCVRGEFDLSSALAFGVLVILFVILMYTGIFLAGPFFAR